MKVEDFIYKCENCGCESTPSNRVLFITEYECGSCMGKVTGDKEATALNHWRSVYANLGYPTTVPTHGDA